MMRAVVEKVAMFLSLSRPFLEANVYLLATSSVQVTSGFSKF